MAAIEPMEQFMVHKVVDLPPVRIPGLGAIDMSITNTVLFMFIGAGLMSVFFLVAAIIVSNLASRVQAQVDTAKLSSRRTSNAG